MEFSALPLSGLILFKPKIFFDNRGLFFESFNQTMLDVIGPIEFVQDNESQSNINVLRGLHFQKPPYEQGKLVRVVSGSVLDTVVDIRTHSPTYGQWYQVELTADNKHMLWIPPGFAHGFLSLSANSVFHYKCTNVYHQPSESGIIWNDPILNIDWPIKNPVVSEKDNQLPSLRNIEHVL